MVRKDYSVLILKIKYKERSKMCMLVHKALKIFYGETCYY